MSEQPSEIISEVEVGGEGKPSVADGMSRAPGYPSPSMALAPVPQQQRRGGMINRFKIPEVGKRDLVGNSQLIKQLVAEFLGTFLLVFFGIGSIITAMGCRGTEHLLHAKVETIGEQLFTECDVINFAQLDDAGRSSWARDRRPSQGGGGSGPSGCRSDPDPEDLEKAIKKILNDKKLKAEYIADYRLFRPGHAPLLIHVSFAFGIAVASIAQAIGHISGAHLNPAVSFGLVAAGECSVLKAVVYSVVQIVGALCGAGLLKVLTWRYIIAIESKEYQDKAAKKDPPKYNPSEHSVGWTLGTSELGTAGYADGIVIECFLTFILVLTVCGATDSLRKDIKGSAPLAIGFAVFLCHIVGISYTGASVNPARSLGPVFFTMKSAKNGLKHLVVYLVGPLLGGILAGLLYNLFFRASPSDDENQQAAPGGAKRSA